MWLTMEKQVNNPHAWDLGQMFGCGRKMLVVYWTILEGDGYRNLRSWVIRRREASDGHGTSHLA
jgi:hypothetical protein